MANSIDHDETPHSWVSHLDLHCLLRPLCRNTSGNIGTRGGTSDEYLQRVFIEKSEKKKLPDMPALSRAMINF